MRWIGVAALVLAGTAQAQVSAPSPLGDTMIEPAQAENAMQFVVSNRVSAISPSCSVLVQTQWDPRQFMFAGAMFDVLAGDDAGGFSNPKRLLTGPGTQDGDVAPDGDAVTGIVSGQLYCDWCCDFVPCNQNPALLWTVTWSTDDFTPRLVPLSTVTYKYDLYIDEQTSVSFLDQLEEATGDIIITCYADCDESTGLGVLDLFDFLCFVNEFNAGAADADCDADGAMTLFDFLCFVNEFNGGC